MVGHIRVSIYREQSNALLPCFKCTDLFLVLAYTVREWSLQPHIVPK